MAFAFNKVLNANNFADDSFACSMYQVGVDTIGITYEQITSLGAAASTTRVYSRNYTISSAALSAEVGVSGAGTYGYWNPVYCANSDNTVRLIGYEAGGEINPYIGFVIKESADSGATWPVSWSGGGSYNNDAFRGLFSDVVTGDVYAVTQSQRVGGYKINVHKRTGSGTWDSHLAFTGSSTNTYFLVAAPNQNCLFVNGKAMIVGSKNNGSVFSLTSSDLTTWVEHQVVSFNDAATRACKVARASDGLIRLMIPTFTPPFATPAPPVIAFSNDVGLTWYNIGTPPGMFMEDEDGHVVGWPYLDGVSFLVDGRARMYCLVADIFNGKFQTFRAWSSAQTSWGLADTATITDGSGNTWNPDYQTTIPSSALAIGDDLFRIAGVWLDAGYAQAWMLKDAGGAMSAGGRTGGGGKPKSFPSEE